MGVDAFHYRGLTTDAVTADAIAHARTNIITTVFDVLDSRIRTTEAQRESIANALLDCLERINDAINAGRVNP
jgi:hypothetical protein